MISQNKNNSKSSRKKNIPSFSKEENSENDFIKQMKENDKKLKESLQIYNNIFRRNESANVNSLLKLRSILINWLKDSDQDLVYSKFMTEKKIKYLLKNREKME